MTPTPHATQANAVSLPQDISPALQRALLAGIMKQDFEAFNARAFEYLQGTKLEPTWHLSAIAQVLHGIAEGQIKRLLITMPPRSLKSHTVSTAFPAWLMARDPRLNILCTSYSDDLAISFANDWRRLLDAPWFKSSYPEARISQRKNREGETRMCKGGSRLSVPAGGSITGRGADLIIIDDPLKASDAYSDAIRSRINDWFGRVVVSRLNDKRTGAIIVVMQRLHPDDLAGKLLEEGGWHHLNLPAVTPVDLSVPLTKGRVHAWTPLQAIREPGPILDDLKRTMGSREFNAQYLQTPVPQDGNVIKLKYFSRFDPQTAPAGKHTKVLSIDTASSDSKSADYSVIQAWEIRGKDYFLTDVRKGQWDYPTLKKNALELSRALGRPRILVEEMGVGFALIKELKASGCNPIKIKLKGSKEQRLTEVLPVIESGRVNLPQNSNWLGDFEAELVSFPAGRNDDQVDTMTQFLNWAERHRPQKFKPTPLRFVPGRGLERI